MPRLLFHITHLNNLKGIIESKGLFSDSRVDASGLAINGIAHNHIKERRLKTPVHIAPGGVVADYVPFYFAPRSPMLYAIHRGNVEHFSEGQEKIVYLVSNATDVASKCNFCFTDGHATMVFTKFFHDINQLENVVDWEIMKEKFWNDTDEDSDRKRRRQAEFLVKDFFPLELIQYVGVFNNKYLSEVKSIFEQFEGCHHPNFLVKRNWYY